MAKAASTLVLPIIFLVMFALVEQNMGCTASMGPCEKDKSCSAKCRATFGDKANGFCDRSTSTGGGGECICVYPCPPLASHESHL
ncbi:hypothetical protein ISN45_Aa03g039380 [Arabidopsis thaliana x Arabidopsis arenosa]|uniref:Defensin-like protein n=2 Tax=Arabidopsis TaxID=3701 RepID=A0A8T2BG80_ARASU|nr:hypothetical protein ISN45_Aa03g039380 [Arabidopsis thaliana x Arabidopsis arenosa]KAG7584482.1 hypothetical protein ISN44_As08g039380 [Arabidopsis suecica]